MMKIRTVAIVVGLLLQLPTFAASNPHPWKAVILSATSGGWFELRGTAKNDASLSTIVVFDAAGSPRETYRGKILGHVWSGTRTVHHSDNINEPLSGRLVSHRHGNNELQILILTNDFVSANFVRNRPLSGK